MIAPLAMSVVAAFGIPMFIILCVLRRSWTWLIVSFIAAIVISLLILLNLQH